MMPCPCAGRGLIQRFVPSSRQIEFVGPNTWDQTKVDVHEDFCDCVVGTRLMEQSLWEIGFLLVRLKGHDPIAGIIIGRKDSTATVQWQDGVSAISLLNDQTARGIIRFTMSLFMGDGE